MKIVVDGPGKWTEKVKGEINKRGRETAANQLADATEILISVAREALSAIEPESYSRLNLRDACNLAEKARAEFLKQG